MSESFHIRTVLEEDSEIKWAHQVVYHKRDNWSHMQYVYIASFCLLYKLQWVFCVCHSLAQLTADVELAIHDLVSYLDPTKVSGLGMGLIMIAQNIYLLSTRLTSTIVSACHIKNMSRYLKGFRGGSCYGVLTIIYHQSSRF